MKAYREVRYRSTDGLVLHAEDWGPEDSALVPILCLAGLTRNARDFETVAPRLAATRRVLCPDYRGRGRSQWAPDPLTYRPDVETADVVALLDCLEIARAAIVGTSRGGIVAMTMAAVDKSRIAGILFNDIGPVIDKAGLVRIRSYLGRAPVMADWNDAVTVLKRTNPGYETLTGPEWFAFARRVFAEKDGRPGLSYDPALAQAFPPGADIAEDKPSPLWPLFDGLAGLPLAVLRGERSDLLSARTVAEMRARMPRLDATTVRDRGHVPFLDEPESAAAIDRWLARVDGAPPPT